MRSIAHSTTPSSDFRLMLVHMLDITATKQQDANMLLNVALKNVTTNVRFESRAMSFFSNTISRSINYNPKRYSVSQQLPAPDQAFYFTLKHALRIGKQSRASVPLAP